MIRRRAAIAAGNLAGGVILALFIFAASSTAICQSAALKPAPLRTAVKAEKFYRTELYFGRSIHGGGTVSEQDWAAFLAEVVTPRFPSGFTILDAHGQYREDGGNIIREQSHVLIFLYTSRSKRESRAKIEEIRTAYIERFNQESVLRVDLPETVRVMF